MGKRFDTPEGSFRVRRGELVLIPDEWVGQCTHPQTQRKRNSKRPPSQKEQGPSKESGYLLDKYWAFKRTGRQAYDGELA